MKKHISAIIITASILISVALLITASVISNKIAIAENEIQDIKDDTLINTMITEEKLDFLNKTINESEIDLVNYNDDALAYLELLKEYDKLTIDSSQVKSERYFLQDQLQDLASNVFGADDLAFSSVNNCYTLITDCIPGEFLIVFDKLNTYSIMGNNGETELWRGTWYIADGTLTLKHQVGSSSQFRPVMTFSVMDNSLLYNQNQHDYVDDHVINTYEQYGIKDGCIFTPYSLDIKEDK